MCSESSGKKPPPSTIITCPYCALMLSAKLARRARPPLGVCQPQGLVFPFTSVVERMISLPGSRMAPGFEVEAAPARSSQQNAARTADARKRESHDFMGLGLREQDAASRERREAYGPAG